RTRLPGSSSWPGPTCRQGSSEPSALQIAECRLQNAEPDAATSARSTRPGRLHLTERTMSALAELEQRALAELNACQDEAGLRAWNTRYFGKQGEVLQAVKDVGKQPQDQRRAYGQQANQIKERLTQAYEEALAREKARALERSLSEGAVDVTLP